MTTQHTPVYVKYGYGPKPQPEPQPHPEQYMCVAAPPLAATELSEKDKKALRVLKTWAKSYQDNKYFAPIVELVSTYPDPE